MNPSAASPAADGKSEICIDVRAADWLDLNFDVTGFCRRAAAEAIDMAGKLSGGGEISIVLADDAFVRDLNRTWRNIDAPTNVLAFPCSAGDESDGAEMLLGDVVVAFQTAQREAAESDIPLAHHFAHLIVHGVLHLLGYDHVDNGDARIMERLEVATLARLGVENPYQE